MNISYKVAGRETVSEQINIYNTVFGATAKLDRWMLKHYNNPATTNAMLYGAFVDDKLVGINGFLEAPYALNDKNFKVVQSCDTAVLPEYRGLGIFSNLIKNAEIEFKQRGFDAIIGFPNMNSYPGFMKLGWLDQKRTNKLFIVSAIPAVVRHMKNISLPKISNAGKALMWRGIKYYYNQSKSIELKKKNDLSVFEYSRFLNKNHIFLTRIKN